MIIYTASTRPELADLCRPSLRAYAKHHGHELCEFNHPVAPTNRHPSWSKLALLQSSVRGSTVAWVDDDIIITDPERNVLGQTAALLEDSLFAVSGDVAPSPFNLGVIVTRITPQVKAAIDWMWAYGELHRDCLTSGWWEQTAAHAYEQKHPGSFWVLPMPMLQSFGGGDPFAQSLNSSRWNPRHFACHLAGLPMNERIAWAQGIAKDAERKAGK